MCVCLYSIDFHNSNLYSYLSNRKTDHIKEKSTKIFTYLVWIVKFETQELKEQKKNLIDKVLIKKNGVLTWVLVGSTALFKVDTFFFEMAFIAVLKQVFNFH